MFKTALWGVEEEEVLDYMDRLLGVIEHQRNRYGEAESGEHRFLIRQLRKDLTSEFHAHKKRRKRRYLFLGICPLLCLAAFLLSCRLWIGAAQVTGESMSPSLRTGDVVIYRRGKGEYRHGEMVVCDVEGVQIIKRVAGVPGDIVRQDDRGNVRIVDGIGGAQSLIAEKAGSQMFLNKDEYYLLGDNREQSVDSRDERIGPVEKRRIKGRVWMVIRFAKEG